MKKIWSKILHVLLPVSLFLNLFGEGDLVNTTVGYRNTNNGTTQAFDSNYTLEPGLKTYYDTELLENTREKRVFAQFGQRQPLPKNRGKTVEWRKWKTLPPAMKAVVEGVNPKGRKMGEIAITKTISQHGDYFDNITANSIGNAWDRCFASANGYTFIITGAQPASELSHPQRQHQSRCCLFDFQERARRDAQV